MAGDAWVLGEDSGIEVAALGGAPGVHSARCAAGDPVGRLLAELNGVENRRARYVCELVALAADGRELRGTGMLEGRIAGEPRGSEGFGYDPIFVPTARSGRWPSSATRGSGENSHRARAAQALRSAIAARRAPRSRPRRARHGRTGATS